ncbi:hypothetical protein D3C81_715260 [compost metagenome]
MHGLDIVAAGLGPERHPAVEPGRHHGLAAGMQVTAEARRDFQGQLDRRALQALVQLAAVADRRLFGEIA